MKREFGKKLIESYFAHEVELTEIIDTSGAYIPGHGTPTVILVGRANKRRRSPAVRAVLGVRGEPSAPDNPGEGLCGGRSLRRSNGRALSLYGRALRIWFVFSLRLIHGAFLVVALSG
nr:hypothetical protein [Micromonospora sp. U56]